MSEAVRLKERVVVFLGLALIGAVFVSCRSLNCIVHLYEAANSFKNITMMAAVYSASKYNSAFLNCNWFSCNLLYSLSFQFIQS